jgi:hypothetical protein
LYRADDGGGFRAPQQVAKREPAGHGVWIRIVVQQNQNAVRVTEEPLILLDARARQRSAELRDQGSAEQLRHAEIRDVREVRFDLLFALGMMTGPHAEHVDQCSTGRLNRVENAAQAAAAVVFNDDASVRSEVGLEVGIGSLQIAGRDVYTRIAQPPGQGAILDEKFDFEAGQQDVIQHPHHQLVVANREALHRADVGPASTSSDRFIGVTFHYTPVARRPPRRQILPTCAAWPRGAKALPTLSPRFGGSPFWG